MKYKIVDFEFKQSPVPHLDKSGLYEKVLCVPKYVFDLFEGNTGNIDIVSFFNETSNVMSYIPRWYANQTKHWVQLVAYVTFVKGSQVFTYKRINTDSDTRLMEKLSVGIGGHVDVSESSESEDLINYIKDVKKLEAFLKYINNPYLNQFLNSLFREVNEEVKITINSNSPIINYSDFHVGGNILSNLISNPGEVRYIKDTSNEIGKAHLGFSFKYHLNNDTDVSIKEIDKLEGLGFFSKYELLNDFSNNLENWSSIILESDF